MFLYQELLTHFKLLIWVWCCKHIFNRAIFGVQGRLGFYVGIASSHACLVCWTKAVHKFLCMFTALNIRKDVFLLCPVLTDAYFCCCAENKLRIKVLQELLVWCWQFKIGNSEKWNCGVLGSDASDLLRSVAMKPKVQHWTASFWAYNTRWKREGIWVDAIKYNPGDRTDCRSGIFLQIWFELDIPVKGSDIAISRLLSIAKAAGAVLNQSLPETVLKYVCMWMCMWPRSYGTLFSGHLTLCPLDSCKA